MDVRELRVGNYVYSSGRICKIWALTLSGKIVVESSRWQSFKWDSETGLPMIENGPDKLEPIPITHDLLDRFGFKDLGNGRVILGDWDFVLYTEKAGKYLIEYNENYTREVNTLHQLQNVYFDLTGRELEAKA